MATVPSSRTWVAGEIVTAAYMNNTIRDVENYLLAPPIFRGFQTAAQTIATSAFTAVLLDSETVDSAGGHSTSVNTSRYTAVYGGWYDKGGGCCFAANATGRRLARVAVNGAAIAASASGMIANAAQVPWAYRPDLIFLNVNDYVEDTIFQDSGGNLATFITNTEYQPSMTLHWSSN